MQLILTGGTIDKHYNELNGELGFSETHIDEMLAQSRTTVDFSISKVMLKDSLEMTDEDREEIAAVCLKSAETQVVITHGTDTMVETAQVLAARLKEAGQEKSVVLFGAMLPYELANSDGLFNFGSAVAAAQLVDAGVYLAMNGKIFPFDDVRKNKAEGLFESLS